MIRVLVFTLLWVSPALAQRTFDVAPTLDVHARDDSNQVANKAGTGYAGEVGKDSEDKAPQAAVVESKGHEGKSAHAEGTGHGEAVGHGEAGGQGQHAGFSAKTFALQLLNFGVMLFILIRFGGPAISKFLRGRHEQLKKDIGEAARSRQEAMAKSEAQANRMATLEKEIADLHASMRTIAEEEQARILASAQEKVTRIQADGRIALDEQVKAAEADLRAEVAAASVKLAEELLKKHISPDDDRRLAREFVTGFDGPQSPTRTVR